MVFAYFEMVAFVLPRDLGCGYAIPTLVSFGRSDSSAACVTRWTRTVLGRLRPIGREMYMGVHKFEAIAPIQRIEAEGCRDGIHSRGGVFPLPPQNETD